MLVTKKGNLKTLIVDLKPRWSFWQIICSVQTAKNIKSTTSNLDWCNLIMCRFNQAEVAELCQLYRTALDRKLGFCRGETYYRGLLRPKLP